MNTRLKKSTNTENILASVIMPVYNSEIYLEQSIKSIIKQTHKYFEYIIINDGSTDGSLDILNQIKDSRIKVINNKINFGNYPSRNAGIRLARGQFIFVMDSDDIALPNRIEVQLNHMISNPEVGICSSSFQILGLNNIINYPNDYELLKVAFIENNYCLHPGLCIRKDLFNDKKSLLYDEHYRYASDYAFIARNFRNFKICNIPEVLMEYRMHPQQITSSKFFEQQFYADQIRINYLSNIKLFPSPKEIKIHLSLMNRKLSFEFTLKDYLSWCNKILKYNAKHHFFKDEFLIGFLKNKLKLTSQ
jgi:glycosyltransferase involved in cell wall biosynthesis